MPRAPWIPRPIRPAEAAVIKQLLKVDPDRRLGEVSLETWLAAVDGLIVREGCDLGSDSLFFDRPRGLGRVIASGIGRSADQSDVEVVLWARGSILTFLELEPYGSRTRYPPRLPRPESVGPYPENPEADDDEEEED